MASKGLLRNPLVQVALALIVILVIATLSFATAISGALKTLRGDFSITSLQSIPFMFVQTAEKLRKTLPLRNCYHCSWITGIDRTHVGIAEGRRLIPSLSRLIPSMISIGV